jgi:hypothetical protein
MERLMDSSSSQGWIKAASSTQLPSAITENSRSNRLVSHAVRMIFYPTRILSHTVHSGKCDNHQKHDAQSHKEKTTTAIDTFSLAGFLRKSLFCAESVFCEVDTHEQSNTVHTWEGIHLSLLESSPFVLVSDKASASQTIQLLIVHVCAAINCLMRYSEILMSHKVAIW